MKTPGIFLYLLQVTSKTSKKNLRKFKIQNELEEKDFESK